MAQPPSAQHSPPTLLYSTLLYIYPPSYNIFSLFHIFFFYSTLFISLFLYISSLYPLSILVLFPPRPGTLRFNFFISSAQICHYSATVPDFLNANVHLRVSTWIHTHKRPHRATMSTLIPARRIPAASSHPQPHMANRVVPYPSSPVPILGREGTLSCL